LKHFTIAIDGPGGAGKSTVADHLAAQLGVPHLDTGAMYRAFGYQALQEQLDPRDPEQMAELATRIRMDVRFENGRQHTLVNGVDVTDRIRTPEISMAASDCGTHAEVRRLMVAMQQKIASVHSMILDGRDIGTRVLPDATLKVFLTASPEVRARRRCDELNAKGQPAVYEDVLNDVIVRDRQDTTRAVDPLTPAADAVTLDTSAMTQTQAEEAVLGLLYRRLSQREQGERKPRERFTFFYRLAMWFSAIVFRLFLPVRYHGLENTELNAPYLLIGNHLHMLDPFLIGWKCNRYQIRYLGKKELIRNPLMRAIHKNLLMIPVDRHNMDMGAVRTCLKTLKEGHVLGIFPEGTRYKTTVMEELESGVGMIALLGNATILPAYVTAKPRLFHRVDCYYGEPFTVRDIAAKGVNRETCDEVLQKITALYRKMAQQYGCGVKAIRK